MKGEKVHDLFRRGKIRKQAIPKFLIGRENHCHTTWRTCIVLHRRTKHSSSMLTGEQCHCGGFAQQPILALAGSSSDSSGCLNLCSFFSCFFLNF